MEPLDDRELGELLRAWQAPGAPANLRPPQRGRSEIRQWLIRGSIRVPVPAVLLAAVIAAICIWWGWTGRRMPETRPGTVSFAEFQPVKELQPRIIRSNYDCQ